ncbi:MAG: TPM domain-containing protein [Saprospiraceae bacterium]|nr:TPM domain-containing protein [Saprospiraceae bacterium]
MFYRMFWVVLIAFSATTLWGQNVYEVETIPNPKDIGVGYVSDPDDVIAASDESQLNNIIRSLEDSTTAQVAVVAVNSIGEKNPKDFATELFRY